MSSSTSTPGRRILEIWRAMERWPGGSRVFGFLIGLVVPYSGTIRPRVRELEPGFCRVELRERRRVRNHLGSVHAVALVNLGELATGLATLTALPPGVRGIVTDLEAEYRKKARGRLTTECRCPVPDPDEIDQPVAHRVECEIRIDREGHLAVRRDERTGLFWTLVVLYGLGFLGFVLAGWLHRTGRLRL